MASSFKSNSSRKSDSEITINKFFFSNYLFFQMNFTQKNTRKHKIFENSIYSSKNASTNIVLIQTVSFCSLSQRV